MKTGTFLLSSLLVLASVLGTEASASAQGTVTFGGGANANTQTDPNAAANVNGQAPATAPPPATTERDLLAEAVANERGGTPTDDAKEKEWQEREAKLNEASTLTGGVGLIHTQHAQGGAVGQFRVGFTTEYFSAGFLCSREFPCADPRNAANVLQTDSADHIGGRLTLSMQVVKWLEAYMATSALANSNPANRPSLLQVLGDSTLGAKAHGAVSKIFHLGGAFELWLVNGTGSVGLDGAGTSAKFRALATADLRNAEKRIPIRFSTNLTYVLDNSGEVVNATEQSRGTSITRIERFGLNVNRVDHFDIHLGAEFFAGEEKVRPFIEYHVLIPVNRQDYRCRPNNPSRDKCLATDPFAPSTLTIGSRFYPWKKGFNLTAALDIGVSGTSFFIEEMRPTPPWMLYLGAGWAFDTVDRPVVRVPAPAATSGRRIRGFVHEEGKAEGIAGAVIAWDNHPETTSLYTGSDGRFTTHDLQVGPYVFAVRADGYKPGQCSTTIGGAAATPAPAGTPPGQWNAGGDVQLDCILQALPRIGNIVGKVKDLDSGNFVNGAIVKVVDVARKELSGSTDQQGGFRFELVTPGESTVTIDADGYLVSSEKLEVKPRQDNLIEISVKKKPKNSLVSVQQKEIIIRQQVQFATDSATILPGSTGLLTEIADTFIKNQRIRRVEVQGHTDGTGTPAHNQKLSEDRAASVVAWLVAHGVDSGRLSAKGYGDSKPLVPNVTDLNKQRNRRVQFIIVDQDPATPAGGATGAGSSPSLGAPALGSGAAKPAPPTLPQ